MPRLRKAQKVKVEQMIQMTVLSSDLSAQHAKEAKRYADVAKKTLARLYIVLREAYPVKRDSDTLDAKPEKN